MGDTTENATTLDLEVEEFSLGTLTTNARAILEAVKAKLAGYSIENYSGDRIQDAKRDKAELNAAAKKLNDKRIEYERIWMKPFEEFKAIVGEATAAIKTASGAIDALVRDVEQGEKDEKQAQIETFWARTGCDLFGLMQIFDPRWLNKTAKMAAIEDEITERVKKVRADLVILERLGEPEAKAHYLNTLDLNAALDEADRIKKNRERIAAEEKARAEAEDRRNADEAAWAKAAEDAKAADKARTKAIVDEILEEEGLASAPAEQTHEPAAAPEPPKLYDLTLRFTATHDELIALRAYVDEHGLKYEKVA